MGSSPPFEWSESFLRSLALFILGKLDFKKQNDVMFLSVGFPFWSCCWVPIDSENGRGSVCPASFAQRPLCLPIGLPFVPFMFFWTKDLCLEA